MKSDLLLNDYNTKQKAGEYIYGSAEVVGLMCLRVFTGGNEVRFKELQKPAMKLGSAFQKVNFLRDLKNDTQNLKRVYFPEIVGEAFNENIKGLIIAEIESEFDEAYIGIKKLPQKTKMAVLAAYYYYKILLLKIRNTPADKILESRIRISNFRKIYLLMKAILVSQLKLI